LQSDTTIKMPEITHNIELPSSAQV